MRLFTHNMLRCNIKGVERGYPLRIEAITTTIIEEPYNSGKSFIPYIGLPSLSVDKVRAMLEKIDYEALKSAADDLSIRVLQDYESIHPGDEIFLRIVHHLLFEFHVLEGHLVCPESGLFDNLKVIICHLGRKFPVTGGIPNMLLHEDEV